MPDFRARVHRGVRRLSSPAIASRSVRPREMSPAGLKGVAEEARLEMVDRLRQQHGRHLPAQRASTSASTSCRVRRLLPMRVTATSSRSDPSSRQLTNVTQGKTLRPGAVDAEGRRDPPQRRHLRDRPPGVSRRPWNDSRSSSCPRAGLALAEMTTTEQIIWAHRVGQEPARAAAGRDAAGLRRSAARLRRHRAVCDPHVQPDHRRQYDLPAAGRDRQRPLRLHRHATTDEQADERSAARSRRSSGSRSRTTRRRATASFISIFPSRGSSSRDSSSRAPTRTAARTARTARSASASARRRSASAGQPATSTSRSPKRGASSFAGRLQPWVSGKDIVLELLRRWGARSSRRACRSSSSTRTGSCRSRIATRSRT